MAYGDYQQPVLKRPNADEPGFDPNGPVPQPEAGGPVDQSTALQQVQQAYMAPTPGLSVQDQTNIPGTGAAAAGYGAGINPPGRGLSIIPPGENAGITGGRAPSQFVDSTTGAAYSPGQGAGMFLGDFLGKQAATPSLNDSTLQPIVAAGRLADQRAFDRNRAALAEQLGAAGLGNSGAMNTGVGKFRQQMGETQALRESGLLQDETDKRRAALLSGLSQDASRYQFDQDAGLQLAKLEALLNGEAVQPFLGGY